MLIKDIHTPDQDVLTESDIQMYDEMQDPHNVIGLHPDGHEGYKKFINRLDPNHPHDKRLLHKIQSGN
jgi:hypothetical protein